MPGADDFAILDGPGFFRIRITRQEHLPPREVLAVEEVLKALIRFVVGGRGHIVQAADRQSDGG